MDIPKITHQRLSELIATYWICKYCGAVDANTGRAQASHKCHQCGEISNEPSALYFPKTTQSLIDLIQEFYHLKPESVLNFKDSSESEKNGHQLVIVILFCTLVEVLFQKFLEGCMASMGIQPPIQERLLKDNLYMHQRIKRLFPTLTGLTWTQAAAALGKRQKQNYSQTVKFYEDASEARNEFLHRGGNWAIPTDMPDQCLRQLKPLILFFVDLHNEFATLLIGQKRLPRKRK